MQCPFCQCEMESGTFHSSGRNFFLPEGKKSPLLYIESVMKKSGAVPLPPDPYALFPEWPKAFCCRSCKKIIIDY